MDIKNIKKRDFLRGFGMVSAGVAAATTNALAQGRPAPDGYPPGVPKATGTDANAMQLAREGVAAGLVSIPNRYMHSPVEVVSLKDLDNAAKLLAEFCLSVTSDANWVP